MHMELTIFEPINIFMDNLFTYFIKFKFTYNFYIILQIDNVKHFV